MDPITELEKIIIELLLVISLVAIVVQYLRIPYTVALVAGGLILGFVEPLPVELTSELILAFFLPPLVFEAAFHMDFKELRENMRLLLMLAVPGVILTMLIVGYILTWTTALPLATALVFGALVSATDPVSVIALFRTLGVPKRLTALVEGESLLNDGTAIVVFSVVLGIALTGRFDVAESVVDFIKVVAGGVAVGSLVGWLGANLIARVDNHLIETTLTTVVAYGSYLIAEQFHFSGVLAVVTAGIINSSMGPRGMSPTTRIILSNFWEYAAFLANSLIFLLIGLQIRLPSLLESWQPILAAIGAVLVARVIVVYWLSNMHFVRKHEPIPPKWRHVMAWGGLRGAISLALALSLPAQLGIANRELLQVMAFGVVLFTLFVQGMTIGPLVRRLKINAVDAAREEYELRHARLVALQEAEKHLDTLYRKGLVTRYTWENLKPRFSRRTSELANSVRELLRAHPDLASQDLESARRELLRAQRSALMNLKIDGVISDPVYEQLVIEIDTQLHETSLPDLLDDSSEQPPHEIVSAD
ncbi:MAG: Na+/H+ antiporter [Anaerolineaceae bacterium]|nr:Na+/H+ antiporter [Anaerolineaceae bacterium]